MLMARMEMARSKLRFALFISAVGLLVFLILFFEVILGSLVTSFVGAIKNQSAPVLVYGSDARRNIAGSLVTPEQVDAVSRVSGVGRAAPLGEATFTLAAGGTDVDVSVFGYRPDGPGVPTKLVAGRLPQGPGEAVASREDESSGFGLGATVETVNAGAVDDEDHRTTTRLEVVGLTEQSRYSVAPTLWVSFDDYVELRRSVNPDARAVLPSVVAVEPADGVSSDQLVERINSEVEGVLAMTRSDAATQAPAVAQVVRSISMILVLAFMIVTLVIGFFFLILTVQKQEALTLLRAVGAPNRYLILGLVSQVVVVATGGLIVGLTLLVVSVNASSGKVPLAVDWSMAVTTSIAVVLLALVGSSVTMLRTLRIDPASAIATQTQPGLT